MIDTTIVLSLLLASRVVTYVQRGIDAIIGVLVEDK